MASAIVHSEPTILESLDSGPVDAVFFWAGLANPQLPEDSLV